MLVIFLYYKIYAQKLIKGESISLNSNAKIVMKYYCIEEKNIVNVPILKKFKCNENIIFLSKRVKSFSEWRQRKIAKKIKRFLEKKEIDRIILSKEIKKNIKFVETLKNQSVKIIDGKRFMKYLAKEIIEYILINSNKEKQKTRIAVLSNELTDLVIEKIKIFASEYKEVTVVTNYPKKILNLENELYTNNGTSIIITNNLKKALLKQDIILNFDFIEEEINKYYINEQAIIVNFENKIKINSKRFVGINIYDYEITCRNNESKDYDIKEIIEGEINFNTSFSNIRKIIKEKEIKIKALTTIRENTI